MKQSVTKHQAEYVLRCHMLYCTFKDQYFLDDSTDFNYVLISPRRTLKCKINHNYEPHREKTGFLPMRKQRRRSALR